MMKGMWTNYFLGKFIEEPQLRGTLSPIILNIFLREIFQLERKDIISLQNVQYNLQKLW